MDSIAAISAAIRERLLAGRPAPLPGLGALVRQHVAARVEERPDGTRVLLPPGETIGLDASSDAPSLAQAFARLRGVGESEAAESAFAAAMDQLEAQLAIKGEVRLPGVGLLRRTSGGVVLGVEADLLAAVNRTYEGLAPVGTGPAAPEPEPTAPEPKTPASAPFALPPAPSPPVVTTVPPSEEGQTPEPGAEAGTSDLATPPASVPSSAVPSGMLAPPADKGDARSGGEEPPADDSPAESEAGEAADPSRFGPSHEGEVEIATALVPPTESAPPPEPLHLDATVEVAPGPATLGAEAVGTPTPSPFEPSAESTARPTSPAESAFVDEGTLDDDLDGVLAVPFGEPGATAADVLPPTPEPAEPVTPPTGTPALDPDAVWTAPGAFETASFEDADYEVVSNSPLKSAPEAGTPPVERVGPDDELAAFYGSTDAPEAPPPVVEVDEPSAPADLRLGRPAAGPDTAAVPELSVPEPSAREAGDPDAVTPIEKRTQRRFPWWILAVLLLAAIVAALVWFWPRLMPPEQDAPPRATPTASAASSPAPAVIAPDDSTGASLTADSLGGPSGVGAPVAAPDGEPVGEPDAGADSGTPPSAAAPARSGSAVLPPRVTGLSETEIAALSGRAPVDPDAEAYTLAVLATSTRASAEAFASRFRSAGYRVGVLEASSGRKWRVGVGQFPTREMAIRLRDRLPPQAPPDTWALDLRTL